MATFTSSYDRRAYDTREAAEAAAAEADRAATADLVALGLDPDEDMVPHHVEYGESVQGWRVMSHAIRHGTCT